MHNEHIWFQAFRHCENSLSSIEKDRVASMLYGLGWEGTTSVPYGWMGHILSQVNSVKYDGSLRTHLLRGFGEDMQ